MTPEQVELVAGAGQGKQECLKELSLQAHGRVRAYLYRMTMDYDLAEDLTQETILEMVSSLDKLRSPESFWAWLYQVARSKLLGHYRSEAKQQRHKTDSFYKEYVARLSDEDSRSNLQCLLSTELAHAVVNAMGRLRSDEREILSLRCLDQLPYSAIAEITRCSESAARIQFFRAKQALRRQLVREGIGKGGLLAALGFFGQLTAPDASAAEGFAVPAATVQVSLGTVITATIGWKLVAGLAGLALLGASSAAVLITARPEPATPMRNRVTSVHFTQHSPVSTAGPQSSLSKGAYEQ